MNTSVGENGPSGSQLLNKVDLNTLVMCAFCFNMILGLPLNGYVLWLMLRGARETLASDFLYLNLTVSEIIFSLSTTWLLFFGQLNCTLCLKIFIFSCGLLLTARPLFQCCICVEYYLGVVHPVLFLRFKPLRYRIVVGCVVWLISIFSCIYYIAILEKLPYLYIYFIQSLLFLFVVLFCCLSVLRALKRPGPGGTETEKKTCNAMKRKALKIISLMMVSMAFNLSLYIVVIPLQCCFGLSAFFKLFTMCINIGLITGFIQPLLYLNRSGKLPCYRKA